MCRIETLEKSQSSISKYGDFMNFLEGSQISGYNSLIITNSQCEQR